MKIRNACMSKGSFGFDIITNSAEALVFGVPSFPIIFSTARRFE